MANKSFQIYQLILLRCIEVTIYLLIIYITTSAVTRLALTGPIVTDICETPNLMVKNARAETKRQLQIEITDLSIAVADDETTHSTTANQASIYRGRQYRAATCFRKQDSHVGSLENKPAALQKSQSLVNLRFVLTKAYGCDYRNTIHLKEGTHPIRQQSFRAG